MVDDNGAQPASGAQSAPWERNGGNSNAPATGMRYIVLAVGCSLALLVYLHRQSFVRGQTEIQKDLGFSSEQMGYFSSAFLVAYGLFQIPCGFLGDRLGARHLLTVLVLGSSLATGMTALAADVGTGMLPFYFLFGVRLLFGAFQAGTFPVWSRVTADWMPVTQRGSALGTIWMFSRIGGALSPFVFLWLFLAFRTWTIPLWLLALLGIVWSVGFWIWFRNRPEEMPQVNAAELELISFGRTAETPVASTPWPAILRSVNVWALCAMYAFTGMAGNFTTNLLPVYLDRNRHLSIKEITLLTSLPLAFGVVSCALGGIVSDWIIRRWGSRKWGRRFNGATGLALAGMTVLAVPWCQSTWLLALLLSASFFFNDMNMAPAWAACADVGERYAGTISGAMNMTGNFAGAAAMAVAGKMLDAKYTTLLFVLFACSYGLASLCWLAVDVTKPLRFGHNQATQ
jgi:MFS transporter, ACS family, glucarate transporter